MSNKADGYSHIDIRVKLDEQKIPASIEWKRLLITNS